MLKAHPAGLHNTAIPHFVIQITKMSLEIVQYHNNESSYSVHVYSEFNMLTTGPTSFIFSFKIIIAHFYGTI